MKHSISGRLVTESAPSETTDRNQIRKAASRISSWARSSSADYLTSIDVPGANPRELHSLSALGAIASHLVPARHGWPDEVSAWAEKAPDLLPDEILELLGTPSLHEVLATAYEGLVSGRNRRALGTFFTPPPIVQHMLDLCDQNSEPPTTVIDPGAGVGAFTQAALARWPSSSVDAVDINVVTLGLLSACVPEPQRTRLRLHLANYLEWTAANRESPTARRLLLGNPPYTRHQHLSAADKNIAQIHAGSLVPSSLAGLATYFAAVGFESLGPDDSLCLLLPGTWCQARYGRELRRALWDATHRMIRIQVFPPAAEVFPGTQVTAMVLYVGPEQTGEPGFYVDELELVPSQSAIDNPSLHVQQVRSARKDRTNVCPERFAAIDRVPPAQGSVLFSDIATVRRGVATGANRFFFLTDELMKTLPEELAVPALVKASQVPGHALTQAAHDRIGRAGGQRWLLSIPEQWVIPPALSDYLRTGEASGFDQRVTTRSRSAWYSVEQVQAPDLFLAPFAQGTHRIIINEIGAVGSNNLYGIYLSDHARWTPTRMARWMRSEDAGRQLRAVGRAYQGKSHKVEPNDLKHLCLPTNALRRGTTH